MARVEHDLEVDLDGNAVWVARTKLGHVSGVTSDDLPACLRDALKAEQDEDKLNQQVAVEYREEARTYR